jgi:hypothetical protein
MTDIEKRFLSMPKQLSAFVIFLCFAAALGVIVQNSHPTPQTAERYPASPATNGGCIGLTDDLLKAINAPSWQQFIEGRSPFSFSLYQTKFHQYKE